MECQDPALLVQDQVVDWRVAILIWWEPRTLRDMWAMTSKASSTCDPVCCRRGLGLRHT